MQSNGFERDVKPRLRGPAHLIRFADDAVLVFKFQEDAQRVYEVIYKRFARFGLKLHPKKTQLIDFRGPAIRPSDIKRESFTFLGFTHYWGRTRQGKDVVKKKTSSKGRPIL